MYLDNSNTTMPHETTIPYELISLPDVTDNAALYRFIRGINFSSHAAKNTLQDLINKIGINKKILCDLTILHLAISANCDLDIVKFLLEKGADVNAEDEYGNTPLHFQGFYSLDLDLDLDIVRLLLEKGANVNARNNELKTSLHFAASTRSQKFVELLVSHEADVNPINKYGITPLQIAIMNGDKNMTELFINKGVDIKELLSCIKEIITSRYSYDYSHVQLPSLSVFADFFIKKGSKYFIGRSTKHEINRIRFFFNEIEECDIEITNKEAIEKIIFIIKGFEKTEKLDFDRVLFKSSIHTINQTFNKNGNNNSDTINQLPIPKCIKELMKNKETISTKNFIMMQNFIKELKK